jgi:hypothetical protein
MKREFLIDYEEKEISQQHQIFSDLKCGHYVNLKEAYLKTQRFGKLNDPLVSPDTLVYTLGETIWSQIPFAGTLIIPVNNTGKTHFLNEHGFEFNDIPNLINLAKETGKVQFVLSKIPILYENLDHLQPIFDELRPPIYSVPWDPFFEPKLFHELKKEFEQLINPSYRTMKIQDIQEISESPNFLKSVLEAKFSIFLHLKFLNWEEALEYIRDYIYHDPRSVDIFFDYVNLITESFFDPLFPSQNRSIEVLNSFNVNITKLRNRPPPIEIGSFIMRKTISKPNTYDGCITAIDSYKDSDLYRLLNSMDKAVKEKNKDRVLTDSKNLEIVLENIWKDANKLRIEKYAVAVGASLSLGVVGSLVAPDQLYPGILASLGFAAADKLLDIKDSFISNKIVKLLNKNFMYNIYDFKSKYKNIIKSN